MTHDERRSSLAATSDRIMAAIGVLKAIELRKRQSIPSTPEYHSLIKDTADKSREIFAAAVEQDRIARGLEPGGPTIEATAEREQERLKT